jgi:uncharacterized FAD-dependent dehydrogenase
VIPVILEQGKDIEARDRDVAKFFGQNILNEDSNICFGLGGAGLYSDGKLNSRIKSKHIGYFKKKLVDLGAPREIIAETFPHLGSDRLHKILRNIKNYLIEKGAVIHLQTKADRLLLNGKRVLGVASGKQEFYGDLTILAIGQASAFWNYLFSKIAVCFKDFAIGPRIEHERSIIDRGQYGKFADRLSAATYKLTYQNERAGVYSFCMCPGGVILNASSRAGELVINGMSNSKRSGPFSNSAIVRTIKDKDLEGHALKGLRFIEEIEKKAYLQGGGLIPGQKIDDFLEERLGSIGKNSIGARAMACDLNRIFPQFVLRDLKLAIVNFCKKIKNFNRGLLFAPETRTSSPFRVDSRNIDLQNIYFIGEGAGLAGGITSSAISGIEQVNAIIADRY